MANTDKVVRVTANGCVDDYASAFTNRFDSLADLSTWTGSTEDAVVDGFAFPFKYVVDSTRQTDGVYSIYGKGSSATRAGRWINTSPYKNVNEFMAKGFSLEQVIRLGGNVMFPPGSYNFSGKKTFENINGLTIYGKGAKIISTDITKPGLYFTNCKNINLDDLEIGYSTVPTANGNDSQHAVQFNFCENVRMDNCYVHDSSEMLICITMCNHVDIMNCRVFNSYRDGIYSHYSANVTYFNNEIRHIKDDAMSFHDYGTDHAKLNEYGYQQAYNFKAINNRVYNAYQGLGSVGADTAEIRGNSFTDTTLAGIGIITSKVITAGTTVFAKNIKVIDNDIVRACTNTTIIDTLQQNFGQAANGRAAICVVSLGDTNQVFSGETKISQNIEIVDNRVRDCAKGGGLFIHMAKDVRHFDNIYVDCAGGGADSLQGNVCEVWNTTGYIDNNNVVIDTRTPIKHNNGVQFVNTTGKYGNWIISRTITGKIDNQSPTTLTDLRKEYFAENNVPYGISGIDPTPGTTDFNTLTKSGGYQVGGTGWHANTHGPSDLAPLGNLLVFTSFNVATQIYSDINGQTSQRTKFDIVGGNWSPWSSPTINKGQIKYGTHTEGTTGGNAVYAWSHGGPSKPTAVSVIAVSGTTAESQRIKSANADGGSVIITHSANLDAGSGSWYWIAYF